MKITHVIPSIDKATGGPARSATHLIVALLNSKNDLKIDLETIKSAEPILSKFEQENGTVHFHEAEFLGRSSALVKALKQSSTDLFHGHGLWQAPVHQMALVARKKNIPYIITPRGMLEPWSLEQGKFKKQLVLTLFQYKDLAQAACLHATAPMEVESIRALGLKNPVAMIPNGINIEEFVEEYPSKTSVPKKILFLSRIHPKKGIELLIDAWRSLDQANTKGWVIEVVGNGDEAYIAELKEKIKAAGVENQIVIKKPVFGQEKIELFRAASLFVLPTYSENFGIVIAEALASYTPVITTKGTPWEELNTANAGWWIDIGVEPLKKALLEALQTSEETLKTKGVNGRRLIEENYSMQSVANKMLDLYDWMLNKAEKPAFVDVF